MMMTLSPQSTLGGEVDLVLAAKQVSGGDSGTAQRLAGSVDHIPLALQGLLFQQSSGHYDFLQFGLKYFDILRCLKYNAFRTLELYTTLKIKCQQHFEKFYEIPNDLPNARK